MHVKVQNFSNNFFHQQIYGSNNGSIANEFTAKSWEKSLVGGSIRVSRIGVGYEGYDGREIPPNIGLNGDQLPYLERPTFSDEQSRLGFVFSRCFPGCFLLMVSIF